MDLEEALEQIRHNRNVSFKELLKICSYFFGNPRIRGSHHIFKMPWSGNPRLNLQSDGSKAKAYQVKQVKHALEKLKESKTENPNE